MNLKMEITEDVIRDLLPLYVSGEVSSDSQRLVQEYLAQDPKLAASVETLKEGMLSFEDVEPSPSERLQVESFQKTRRAVRRDNILLGFGIAYLLAPLSFLFVGTHITWIMLRDNPLQSAFFVFAGVVCLLLRFMFRRKHGL